MRKHSERSVVTAVPNRKPQLDFPALEITTKILHTSYWDWTLDANNFLRSPLWDPNSGFGGNGAPTPPNDSPFAIPGATGGGCVTNGPFKDFRLHLGPGDSLNATNRCLTRGFSPTIAKNFSNTAKVNKALSQVNFGWFDKVVEGETNFINVGIHGGGHYSIGGEVRFFHS